MIGITLIITVFLDCRCLLTVPNHPHKALYSSVNLIDVRVLLHYLLIQLYCVGHSILGGQQWIVVDSDIIINQDRGIVLVVRRCGLGSKTLWGGDCSRFGCLLLCRRSLCKGLPFSHDDGDDEGDSDVELVGGGWWKGFFAGFLYILLENFAK